MLVTTPQIARAHDLDSLTLHATVRGETLERVREFKLLGTWVSDDLKWTCNVKNIASSCYAM